MVGVRTALVTLSPLLSDIITQAVERDVKLDVVARVDDRDSLGERLRLVGPELVLIGLRAGESAAIAATALAAAPTAKVIALSADCSYAYMHEMRPYQATIVDITPAALAGAILGQQLGAPA